MASTLASSSTTTTTDANYEERVVLETNAREFLIESTSEGTRDLYEQVDRPNGKWPIKPLPQLPSQQEINPTKQTSNTPPQQSASTVIKYAMKSDFDSVVQY